MFNLSPQTWERNLLSLAAQARGTAASSRYRPPADRQLLRRAFAECEKVTAQHSTSFHLASRLLPPAKRRAIWALYAFCRVTDNIVDCPDQNAAAALADWRTQALSKQPTPCDLILAAWEDTRVRYRIPTRYAEQLIEGVARDLGQKRYDTFEQLAEYAYGVACTVGLMSMHIIGFSGPEAVPYAIKLGVALQVTNILRDVGEDWRAGRVYLPQRELSEFGVTEADLAAGVVNRRWREFMRFQITRNRCLYDEATPGIALLHKDGRLAVAAAAGLYRAILEDIEANDYDVFTRRAHVDHWGALGRLARVWWRSGSDGGL